MPNRTPPATLASRERLHLHDVPGRQVLRPGAAGAVEHLAVVPARREDRRARAERRRQVDGAPHHGRARGAVVRDRRARTGRIGRAALPGARARSREERPRERRGRRPRVARPARPFQRDLREVRRARRGLRRAARGAGEGAGRDRPPRPLAARRDARPRDGRAPPARRRPRSRDALGWGAPARRARATASLRRPTCCCSTSRRTISTPSRSAWLERFLDDYKGTVVAVTHDRYFLDNVAGWILELDRGKGLPFEGNYSSWLEQKQARLAVEEKQASARQRTLARELEWVRASPRARHAKSKARLGAYEKLFAEEQNVKLDRVEIHIPPGPRLGDVVIEAERRREGLRRPPAVRGALRSRCRRPASSG